MIVSNLKNSSRIESLHPLFRTLFEYVKSHDLLHADLGRIDIAGDDLYINNVAADGVSADKQPLEVHRAYIDVHILLEGVERIGWKPLEDVTEEIKSYSEEGDCALYSDRATTYIDLRPGEYVQSITYEHIPEKESNIVLKIMTYEPKTYYSAGSINLNTKVKG